MCRDVPGPGCRLPLLLLMLLQVLALSLVTPAIQAQATEYRETETDHSRDTELISEESNSTFKAWNRTVVADRGRLDLDISLNTTSPDSNSPRQRSGVPRTSLISSRNAVCSSQLYSCRNRCGLQPRPACSCHYTCQVYGNCCEDFTEFCPSQLAVSVMKLENSPRELGSIESLFQSNSTTTRCLGGSLVITSCSKHFDDAQLSDMRREIEDHKDSAHYSWMLQQLSVLQAAEFVSRCTEPAVVGTNYLGENPVTVNSTGLHFRNFYCAVCNGFSSLQFWLGFGVCSQLELFEEESGLAVCDKPMVYLPSQGNPNSCFLKSQLVHPDQGLGEKDFGRIGNFSVTASYHSMNVSNRETVGHLVETNEAGQLVLNASSGIGINLVGVSTPARENQSDEEVLALLERCEQLRAYVSVLMASREVYKNIYCYRLLHGYSSTHLPSQQCEPVVPRLPVDIYGHYRTFWPEIVSSEEGSEGSGNNISQRVGSPGQGQSEGQIELNLAARDFTERDFTFKLLGQESVPSCDTSKFIIVDDKCLRMAFFLYVFVSFDFERSSLIKGNYKTSAESYTRFVSDTMTSEISPTFFCETVLVKLTELAKREHEGEVKLRCVEIPLPQGLDNTTGEGDAGLGQADFSMEQGEESGQTPQTVNGQPVKDARVRRYLDFATQGFHAIHSGNGVMKLPGSVGIRLCLTDMYWSVNTQDTHQYHDYCASYKLRWHAQANIDGVVGEISLEGIITIICCVLSDIGLLVRLALQQVVPFYKTYPAKVQFSLCLTLLFAYTLFLLGGIVDEGSRACRIISTMTHLAFLSALFWMNVTAFEIWRTFRHWRNQVVSRGRASLVLSAFYAVGIPLAIVITALVIEELYPWSEFSPNYGEYFCWLNGSMAVAIFFVTPCSAICGMNAIFVGLTLRGLRRQRTSISEFKKSNTVTAITDTTIVVKIILLVGITWLLGLLAAMVNHQVLWIIFTIINASLGFLISAVLVLNKRVFYAVQKKCLCYSTDSIAVVSTQVARH